MKIANIFPTIDHPIQDLDDEYESDDSQEMPTEEESYDCETETVPAFDSNTSTRNPHTSVDHPSLVAYTYCQKTHRFIPGPRCSQGPLPTEPTTTMLTHETARIRGDSVSIKIRLKSRLKHHLHVD